MTLENASLNDLSKKLGVAVASLGVCSGATNAETIVQFGEQVSLDVNDITNSMFFIDLNNDGFSDAGISVFDQPNLNSTFDLLRFSGVQAFGGISSDPFTGEFGTGGDGTGYVGVDPDGFLGSDDEALTPLDVGDIIDFDGNSTVVSVGQLLTDFALGKYVGVEFLSADSVQHVGFFKVEYDEANQKVLLSDYGFQSTAGADITVIPEPASLAALAAGATAVLGRRRRDY